MNKRPSVFADIAIPATPNATQAEVKATDTPAKGENELFRTSLYLSRPVHEKLREIAFHERKRVNDLLIEGLDKVFAERGYPSSEEMKSSAKAS
jgi:hypothetical protein